ncbi:MAG: hypothetical protein R6V01_06090 [Thermoplasmatota archaeon]
MGITDLVNGNAMINDNPFGWAFGSFGIVSIILVILGILLCFWVYRDANKHGKSGLLWTALMVVGIIFSPIWIVVLIVYLLIRK